MVTTFPFTAEEDPQLKRRSRILAAIISGALLLILLIVFIFLKFVTPIPAIPPDPEVVTVEIGLLDGSGGNAVDQGGGSNGNTGTPGTQPQDVVKPTNPPPGGSITDPNSDNISVNPGNSNSTPTPSSALQATIAAFNKNHGKASINIGGDGKGDPYTGGLGNGSGIDQGPGHGDPGTGTPGGHNGTSQLGSGNRVRKILSKPEIVNPTQTEGKVVVNVYVDRTGKVVKTEVEPNGTTTLNPTLRATATQSAYKIVFDADPTGPEILLLPIDIYFTLK